MKVASCPIFEICDTTLKNNQKKPTLFFSFLLDVAETISEFYSTTKHVKPPPKTALSNYDIDRYLHELGQVTREQDQIQLLRKITEKSTINDLRMFIRLIQKDLVNIEYYFVIYISLIT